MRASAQPASGRCLRCSLGIRSSRARSDASHPAYSRARTLLRDAAGAGQRRFCYTRTPFSQPRTHSWPTIICSPPSRFRKGIRTRLPTRSPMPCSMPSCAKIRPAAWPARPWSRPAWSSSPARSRPRPGSIWRSWCARPCCDIGYNHSDMGFDGASCGVINIIGKQSPDIAMGVDRGDKTQAGRRRPGPDVRLRHQRDRRADAGADHAGAPPGQAPGRSAPHAASCDWLRPDAKSQVTLRYENDRPVGIEAVVLSTQHSDDISTTQAARSGHGGDHQAGAAEEVARPAHPLSHQSDRPLRRSAARSATAA